MEFCAVMTAITEKDFDRVRNLFSKGMHFTESQETQLLLAAEKSATAIFTLVMNAIDITRITPYFAPWSTKHTILFRLAKSNALDDGDNEMYKDYPNPPPLGEYESIEEESEEDGVDADEYSQNDAEIVCEGCLLQECGQEAHMLHPYGCLHDEEECALCL